MEAIHVIEEFEHGDAYYAVTVSIDFDASKYWPGDYWNPPEGGEIEINSVEVTGIADDNGDVDSATALLVETAFLAKQKDGRFDDEFLEACSEAV